MKKIKKTNKFYFISKKVLNLIKTTFNNDLISLILCGSAGRGNFIENWSDLDYCCIIKHTDITKISHVFSQLKNFKIKIGISFFTSKEWENRWITRHNLVMLYEIHQGFHYLIYNKKNFKIPDFDCDEIFNCKQEYLIVLQLFKKNFQVYNFRKLFKTMILLKKQLLYFKKIIEWDYDIIDNKIRELYNFTEPNSFNLVQTNKFDDLKLYAINFAKFLDNINLN